MLEENGIEISKRTLMTLFAIVNPRRPLELSLEEFIKFSFDEGANKSKPLIFNHFRVQEHHKENKEDHIRQNS
jgi:hypothetical protein